MDPDYLLSLSALAGNLGVIGLAGTISAPIAMFKIAQGDGRNPIVWTMISILFTGLALYFIGGIFTGPVGLLLSFTTMWIRNSFRPNLYE